MSLLAFPDFSDYVNKDKLLGSVLVLGLLALVIYLVQLIWNKVIIKKFPTLNMKELTYWEALALMVFTGLLFRK